MTADTDTPLLAIATWLDRCDGPCCAAGDDDDTRGEGE